MIDKQAGGVFYGEMTWDNTGAAAAEFNDDQTRLHRHHIDGASHASGTVLLARIPEAVRLIKNGDARRPANRINACCRNEL